jgi:hypothetical protein
VKRKELRWTPGLGRVHRSIDRFRRHSLAPTETVTVRIWDSNLSQFSSFIPRFSIVNSHSKPMNTLLSMRVLRGLHCQARRVGGTGKSNFFRLHSPHLVRAGDCLLSRGRLEFSLESLTNLSRAFVGANLAPCNASLSAMDFRYTEEISHSHFVADSV